MKRRWSYFPIAILAAWALSSSAIAQDYGAVVGAQALRTKAVETGVIRVIARLVAPAGQLLSGALLDAAQGDLRTEMAAVDVPYVEPLANLPYTVIELTPAQLDSLVASGLIESVQEDTIEGTYLTQSVPLIDAPGAWSRGARGGGQHIAILDTGVDRNHPFLGGRVVAEACFSSNSPSQGASTVCPNGLTSQTGTGAGRNCTISGCDHGTHVAGIAAGSGANFSGVAPDASIIAIQVFSRFVDQPGGPRSCANAGTNSPCVLTFRSDQIRGLQHVLTLANERDIASANMSLGGGQFTTACDSDLRKASIDQLRGVGVATVIASGNDGFTNAVGTPGCISSAVTVGSTTKSDNVSGFSNSATLVDLLAPGSSINSSVPGGIFQSFNGTSMATPHVAGAFAVLRSGATTATVQQIENALITSGQSVTDPRNNITKPRIDVAAALDHLIGPIVTDVPEPSAVSACSLCFTCGGDWPNFGGVIPTRKNAMPYERGSFCTGDLIPRSDTGPYLCCQ